MELGNQLDISQGCVIEKKKGLDASQLKIIALITMLIDHIGAIIIPFLQGYTENMTTFIALEGIMVIMRLVGRISFPIFAFLIVNGFYHTRNRKKYLLRLSIFALISEPFFDVAISGRWLEFTHQNVFFTLALGLLAIWGYDNISKDQGVKFIGGLFIILIGLMAANLRTDYDLYGILTIFIMYLFFENKTRMSIMLVVLNLLLYGQSIGVWSSVSSFIHDGYGFVTTDGLGVILQVLVYLQCIAQLFCLVALWPISKYNGEKGSIKLNKYFFYAFYPLHLFILNLMIVILKNIL